MKTNVHYMGFGFPVLLINVENVKGEDGSFYLDIPHQKLAKALFVTVVLKQAPLTGSELKFLRKYLDMTQQDFAKLIGAKGHSNVAGWENKADKPTGMVEQAEMIARLKLAVEFSGGEITIEDVYAKIIKVGLTKEKSMIELNMHDVA